MSLVVAYGVYLECCEGVIEPEWKVKDKDTMSFFEFRERLAKQMLEYAPNNEHLPGDEYMRSVTSVPRLNRNNKNDNQKRKAGEKKGMITHTQFRKAKRSRSTRLCGDLGKLCKHVSSVTKLTKPKICAWCGQNAYTQCNLCLDDKRKPVVLHYNAKKGCGKNELCFFHYHNDCMFGLGRNDSTKLLDGVKGDWNPPDTASIRSNSEHVKTIKSKNKET